MATIIKDLGVVTAYAYAVLGGYTGTEEEFTELLGNIATDLSQIENLQVVVNGLPAGSDPTSSYSDGVLTLGIPKGDKGDGIAHISITTLAAGSQATASYDASTETLSLGIPKGDKGEIGATGNGIASIEKTGTSGLVDTYTITYTNGDTDTFEVHNGTAAVDDTLTIQGAAADAKKTGDEISDLKSALDDVKDVTTEEKRETSVTNIFQELTWSDGYMSKKGVVGGGDTYRHSQIYPVSSGDVVYFVNSNFTFSFITAFNGQTVVESSGQQGGNSYTVPQWIDGIVISEYVSRGTAAINRTHTTITLVNVLDDAVNSALKDTPVWTMSAENVTWTTGKYMGNNGTVVSSSGLNYSSEIAVRQNDILLYSNDNYKFRFVCAYDANGIAVSDKGKASDSKFYIVPEGITSVIVTVYDVAMNSGTDLLHISAPVEKKADIPLYGNGSVIARTDTMTDDDSLTLPGNNCKIGSRYQFSCKVSEFGSIEFAMGTTHVVVDDTNIIFKNGTTTQATVPHGLTIATELLLTLQNETSIRPSYVSVSSLGNRFEYNGSNNITFLLDSGVPTIKCVEGSLTNCAFSFTSSHIFKPVWIFGDSYLSWYDTRWTYYAAEDGNTENVFFSGYAGQNSQSALATLGNELELATPKILVWCLGMNDPDTDDAVNVGWNMCYEQVKKICEYKNIELILYTTPTTPTMNNRHKNAIVRTSGYRYVDVDGLIRINDNGNWIDGALASDNVHPTELGAKLIYHRFLSDLPEIMTM